ncbi:TfuA-like protein [Legionella busanensis]|uniref:TfuA-like protein n=1 Tax=Legionella busanensis TaxID=190655 RepID=A0A378KAA0_9GAMM|nr:TfuA-like protein [Legionella busanensis]STX81250.1 TfuA-like protein [Legionella busanensis]
MNETAVFLETSLSHQEAIKLLPNADYLPSVKKGDVLKAIQKGYKRLVIIDGNFSWAPSVWHKEILIALDYGIEVFGAASMGAIRSAELDVFGMRGFGRIYEMYKNEEIDGDDEVAIVYSKYNNSQTIPMVNIRATLEQVSIDNKEESLRLVQSIFYGERTWDKISKVLSYDLYHLIKINYIDLKKEDAKLLLLYLNEHQTYDKDLNTCRQKRNFTLFEKKLIESTLSPVLFKFELEGKEGFADPRRAKNLIKLLSIPKTKINLLYYQSLLVMIDQQSYDIPEKEIIYQIELFREEHNLLRGAEFISWVRGKYLYYSNLMEVFKDYVKCNKYLVSSYDYNNYFN